MRPEDVRKAAQHGEVGSRVFRVTSAARIAELLSVLDLGACILSVLTIEKTRGW